MLYKLARLMQLVGLLLLPLAIAGNVADPQQMDLRRSLGLSCIGMLIFGAGWLLQQATKPR